MVGGAGNAPAGTSLQIIMPIALQATVENTTLTDVGDRGVSYNNPVKFPYQLQPRSLND